MKILIYANLLKGEEEVEDSIIQEIIEFHIFINGNQKYIGNLKRFEHSDFSP